MSGTARLIHKITCLEAEIERLQADQQDAAHLAAENFERAKRAEADIERLQAEPTLSDFLDYVTEVYGSGHPAHIAATMFVDRLNTQAAKELE